MNVQSYPPTVAEHLARRLAELPGGTRVALVWDPEGHVSAGVDLVDVSGHPWHILEFTGNDAHFAKTWLGRNEGSRSLVLLRLGKLAQVGLLDLSFQERLL